jgi:lipopolysaccharide/colanic/teichoic acid biosynthesis glycosyltransferase
MTKRLLDIACAALGLVLAAPVLALAALAIRLSSPGPVLFRSPRVGRGGRPFAMYKLRTMRVDHGGLTSPITRARDPRVFPAGALLRRTKLDELPQLVNVLTGDMSIVGPRPEDPTIVAAHYTDEQRLTLEVRPGLTSPGTLYYEIHALPELDAEDAETRYVTRIMPRKLAMDLAYTRRATLVSDLAVIARTAAVVTAQMMQRRRPPAPRLTSREDLA